MKPDPKAVILVSVQLLGIAYLAVTGPVFRSNPWGLLAQAAALALGLWAIVYLRLQLRVGPGPAAGARLIQSGPYRLIRHPLYTAALVFVLVMLLNRLTPDRVAVWLILMIDLAVKIPFEERLLCERFSDYRGYMARTKRLIPFVF